MASKPTTFTYVFVPCDVTASIEERSMQQPEGQEVECLTTALQEYFRTQGLAISDQENKAAIRETLQQQLPPGTEITDAMLDTACGMQLVESIPLQRGGPHSKFIHVNMYGDDRSQAKKLPVNERACRLTDACGAPSQVFGDVFIGRIYEDADDFYRLDFALADMDSSAGWVREAFAYNADKMGGGNGQARLQEFGQQVGASVSAPPGPPPQPKRQKAKDITQPGEHTWQDEEEEVIVSVICPKATKGNQVKCIFKPDNIKLDVLTLPEPTVLQGELFQRVDVEDCNWEIEDVKGADVRRLTITLTKAKPMRWLVLLR